MDLNDIKYMAIILWLCAVSIPSCASDENELWLLICTNEDANITIDGLASFLSSKGYDVQPMYSCVEVRLSNGKTRYLIPNGCDPKLADMWINLPKGNAKPEEIVHDHTSIKMTSSALSAVDTICKNTKYKKSKNSEFIGQLENCDHFPIAPLGMCYQGTQDMARTYKGRGYNIRYMYMPTTGTLSQSHIWIIVENPEEKGSWAAVDSYLGIVQDDNYYTAPYSFPDLEDLNLLNPQCLVCL